MLEVIKTPCQPLVGADVEGFVMLRSDYEYVPVVGLLGGTKEDPKPMPGLKSGFAYQEDNVLAEFNIPPADNAASFMKSIKSAKSGLRKALGNKYAVDYSQDTIRFKSNLLRSKQAKTIGCEPDFDAYQGGDIRTKIPPLTNFRSAGGHVHIGGDFQCPDWVAALFADLYIGVAGQAVVFTGTSRSRWYGKPGIYRPKPYGIEYRTPSCCWVDADSTAMRVGQYALQLSVFLTESDAAVIQKAFRGIDWMKVHDLLDGKAKTGYSTARAQIIDMANKAGVYL